ncbi:MAG: methionine--tRNA ligase [Planctomycetota bacterium]
MPKALVTSALPYANGPIHFGHIAGAYLPADLYTRFRRLCGDEVHFVCGTDEHGVAITLKAEQAGQSYESYVDHWHEVIQKALARLEIEFDVFTGTSHHRNPEHRALAQQFFEDLDKNGYLLRKTEEQFFSEKSQRFLPDRYVEGTCYLCGYEKARGDECPNCGRFLEAKRLKNPVSTIDGSSPVLKETTHWYLDLGKARDTWLREWIESKTDWKSNVKNFVLGDLDELRERAITRDLPWGVPVPREDADGKVLYVWFDAPIGYLSISKQHWEAKGQPERFEEFWKGEDTELFHFIGKDNITFHAVVFPSILRGAGKDENGREWIVAKNVPANEFFNLEGKKFSTSGGWSIPDEAVATDPVDTLRYALTAMMPETADSEWTWEEFRSRVNDELADNFGNFASRTLRFVERFFDGTIPALGELDDPADRELYEAIETARTESKAHFSSFQFRKAAGDLMALGAAANRYVDSQEPWQLVKSEETKPRAAQVVRLCVEALRCMALCGSPILPNTARIVREALGLEGLAPGWEHLTIDTDKAPFGTDSWTTAAMPSRRLTLAFQEFTDARGKTVRALFQKISEDRVTEEKKKLEAAAAAADTGSSEATESKFEPLIDTVEFDTFVATDIRVGKILECEKHPKADRLLVTKVDLGFEQRTIVAGIAATYAPEDLVGRMVSVVANLAPRKLRGIESQGMLLASDGEDGKPRLVSPDPDSPPGTRVG